MIKKGDGCLYPGPKIKDDDLRLFGFFTAVFIIFVLKIILEGVKLG